MPSATSSRRFWPPERVWVERCALLGQPDPLDHLVRVVGVRVVAGEEPDHLLDPAARRTRRCPAARCRSGPARRRSACAGSAPSTRHLAGVAAAVALEDLHRGRLAGAVRARAARTPRPAHRQVQAVDGVRRTPSAPTTTIASSAMPVIMWRRQAVTPSRVVAVSAVGRLGVERPRRGSERRGKAVMARASERPKRAGRSQ